MDKLTVVKKKSKCDFCGLSQCDSFSYGVMYKLGNIVAHYYCVLLSTSLSQNGKDDEGMFGFLYSDVRQELKNTSTVLCIYCKRGNASLKCAFKNCKRSFHRPCGLKNGSLSQFIGCFKSFCHKHCPVQNIPKDILQEAQKVQLNCCICFERLNIDNKRDVLWAPCCSKAWYHTYCIQKLAYSAGYFFRCPACNDVKKFSKCVQEFGIFIPQQDASWELVPNAYEELLFKYNKCDAKVCLCPLGRQGNKDSMTWEIILCKSCGSQGIHAACGGLKHSNSEWECPDCQKVTGSITCKKKASIEHKSNGDSSEILKLIGIHQKKRRRGSEDLENLVLDKRKKCRQDVQEDEIEIDVETVDGETKDNKSKRLVDEPKDACKGLINEDIVEVNRPDPQEVLTLLRPGPLSYKLQLIRNALKNSKTPGVTSIKDKSGKPTPLIVLTDSEEEAEDDDDVKVIGCEKKTLEKHPPLNSPTKWNGETTDSMSNEREKSYNLVFSSDFPKTLETHFSLNDFDTLAVMTFHSLGDEEKDALNKFSEQVGGTTACEKYFLVYPVTPNKSLNLYSKKETCVGIEDFKLEIDTIKNIGLEQVTDGGVEFSCSLSTTM